MVTTRSQSRKQAAFDASAEISELYTRSFEKRMLYFTLFINKQLSVVELARLQGESSDRRKETIGKTYNLINAWIICPMKIKYTDYLNLLDIFKTKAVSLLNDLERQNDNSSPLKVILEQFLQRVARYEKSVETIKRWFRMTSKNRRMKKNVAVIRCLSKHTNLDIIQTILSY
jgi:hypothetical protein